MMDTTVKYFTEASPDMPWLLARVRWPDIAQVVTKADPVWRDDKDALRYLWDSDGAITTPDEAARIAHAWGVTLPA